jgi:hypothetical protein
VQSGDLCQFPSGFEPSICTSLITALTRLLVMKVIAVMMIMTFQILCYLLTHNSYAIETLALIATVARVETVLLNSLRVETGLQLT